MTTINVSGESAPYVSKGLKFLTLADWKSNYRDSENADDADGQVMENLDMLSNLQIVESLD